MVLIKQYNLTNYIVDVFKKDINTITVDESVLDNLYNQLNTLAYPSDIVEVLQNLDGIKQITVYNTSNELLLNSINGIEDLEII